MVRCGGATTSNAGRREIVSNRSEGEAVAGFSGCRITNLLGYKILNQESTHGKHKETKQGRTQKIETHRAQESEGGKAAEAAGICPWLEEAQSEEDGARRGEAVKRQHLAFSTWPSG
jgi:hypothetical protein